MVRGDRVRRVGNAGDRGLAPAASQAAVGTTCRWELTPSPLWLTDPGARINVIGGRYNLPNQTGVAYKMRDSC